MKYQIIDKLYKFLKLKPQLKEEMEVIYLLVEIRKILDKVRDKYKTDNYGLIRFHADWALHTKKDKISPAISEIMDKIEKSVNPYPRNNDIDFIELPELRKELIAFTKEYMLPNNFCAIDQNWKSFMVILSEVLSDQPIINPTPNIAEFRYVGINREGIMVTIDFRGERSGFSATLGFRL